MSNDARAAEAQCRAAAKKAAKNEARATQAAWHDEVRTSNAVYSEGVGFRNAGVAWLIAVYPVIVGVLAVVFIGFAMVGDWRWLGIWLALTAALAVAALLRRLFIPERIHWLYDLVVGGGILFGAALLALRLWSTVSLGY